MRLRRLLSKILAAAFIMTNILAVQPPVGMAAGQDNPRPEVRYEDRERAEIIVKYKNQSKSENIKSQVKGKLRLSRLETKRKFTGSRIDILETDINDNMDSVMEELRKNPDVEYVQPNYKLQITAAPADARFGEQWGLLNNGQEVEGKTGRSSVDINAVNAWDLTTGSPSVVIGVLDTGVDINHDDLKNNIYTNTSEIAGNGIDDDNNGYIDDVNGWDFANGDKTVFDSSEADTHGTYVSGIIAASANSTGISGVAPNVKILPLKFINGNSGYTCDAIEAIEYAMAKGVKIINCSFGGTDNNYALKDAMQNSGILFICAAGNRGGDISSLPVYPAFFDIPNVLSVAALDSMGVLAPYSSYGSRVDVAAPGSNIISTSSDNGYDFFYGTSASAPFVTGIAALIKSYLPAATITEIADRIRNNVTQCTNLQGKVASGGRVDAFASLTNTPSQPDTYTGPGQNDDTIPAGDQGGEQDTWYTQDQLSRIKEKLHYGESGVNPASGNYSINCIDMSIPAPGFQINISRAYNSRDEKSMPLGRGWTFGFEGSVQGTDVVEVTLPSGGAQRFRKSGSTYTPEDSRSTFVKNSDSTYTLTTKDQYTYGFNANGRLVWMEDRNGNRVTIEVDTGGKVKKITDTVGRDYTVAYNSNGLIDTVTDPTGRVIKYDYTKTNNIYYLTSVKDPMGGFMYYGYDSSGFLIKAEDNNHKTVQSMTYNHSVGKNQHKVSQAVDSNGHICNYSYDPDGKKTTITDTKGRTWTYWYDEAFYTTKLQDAEGKFEYTEYFLESGKNKYGDVKSTTDRNGNKTQYEIDAKGNVTKITNPDGSSRSYAFDDKNNLISETDEVGRRTYYIYDNDKKNLLKKVQPLDGTGEYADGVSNPGGFAITEYTYFTRAEAQAQFNCNAGGLVRSSTDPEGCMTEYKYDIDGNVKEIKLPGTNQQYDITSYEYNRIGWKTAEISPKGYRTEFTYDKNGFLIKTKLQGGETYRAVYDLLGRKIKEISPNQYNAPDDDIVNYAYNGDYGYRYAYFDSGKLMSATDPENSTTSYTYDVYGNVLTETKPNGSVYVYDYDGMDRLVRESFKETASSENSRILEEHSYAILEDGRTQNTDTVYLNNIEKAITVSIYDYAGRLLEKQNPDGTRTKTQYNPDGSVQSSTAENGGITRYNYDGMGRLTESWTPFEVSEGNTLYAYTGYSYNKTNKILTQRSGKGKVPLSELPADFYTKNYTYYTNGKVETATDDENRRTAYEYDPEGNISKEETDIDASQKSDTEYEYNHLGKMAKKMVHVKAGDLAGNGFENDQDAVLTTDYTYDGNGNLKTVRTPDNVTTTYVYDNMNRLKSTSQPGLNELDENVDITASIGYDLMGNVSNRTDAKGNETQYSYSKRGFLEKITDALNGVTAYYYDLAGRKVAEVSAENYIPGADISQMNRAEYTYDLMGRLKTKINKFNEMKVNPLTFELAPTWAEVTAKAFKYDNTGSVVKELDALGYASGSGNTADEKILTGYGTEYTYNLAGKQVTVRDAVAAERALPYTAKYEYDALGRKTSETDAKGVITLYQFDGAGNVLQISHKKNIYSSETVLQVNTYDLAGNLLTQEDGNGNTTTYEYNKLNQVRKAVYPGDETIPSNTVVYQYDEMGNLAIKRDGMEKEQLYSYDRQNRVISQTERRQDGSEAITTSAKYDKNGNIRFQTDGNGKITESTFDELNRKTSAKIVVNGVEQITGFGYDKNGNPTTATDWRGNINRNVYDGLNRLVETKDAFGVSIQKLEYDKNGAQMKSYDALNNVTGFAYDRNGRLISTTDPEGHTTKQSYDDVGNIQSKTDGRNISTSYSYDDFNRLAAVTNSRSEKTSYTYDLNGNMLTQTDGKGNTTAYEYNVANKIIKRIDPGGRLGEHYNYTYIWAKVERYTYNADGSMATKQDRDGETTLYGYDIHGRMVSQSVGENAISYTYDNNGNELTMTDSTGTTSRTYDGLGRVLTKTVPDIGTSVFGYDIIADVADGCIMERSTDPKGNITEKTTDRAGRLWKVTADGGTTTYKYYDNGNREYVLYPNGAKEEYTYYRDNLIWTLTNKKADGSVIDTYSYEYDAAHNQTKKTDSKGETYYTYDSLNRLDSVTEPDGKITAYRYDKAGNRIEESVTAGGSTVSTTYTYNEQNRLVLTNTQANGTSEKVSYSYDDNGNMASRTKSVTKPVDPNLPSEFALEKAGLTTNTDVAFYEYDVWNQLSKSVEGSNTINYTYNGNGLRVGKEVNGQLTRYMYEGDKVVLELNGEGTQTARNVQGLNLLARTSGAETLYYLYNGHADVTALLGTDGTVETTYYYDAFGNIVDHTGVDSNITYAGYQFDKETGLYYLNSRYYDSKIARFLTEDTYTGNPSDPLSLNLYTYCHNEPIMYTDPTGHTDAKNSSTKIILDKDGDIQVVSPRQTVIIYKDDPLYKVLLNGGSIGLADDNKSSSSSSGKSKKDSKSIGTTLYDTDVISSYNVDAFRDYVVSMGPIFTKATDNVSGTANNSNIKSQIDAEPNKLEYYHGKLYAYNTGIFDFAGISEKTDYSETYFYKNKNGETVYKEWTISDDEFIDSDALSLEQITEILKKKNPELVTRGFDKAIAEFANKKGINPKVILATLGQEQNWCRNGNYDKAFGVGPGGNPSSFADNEKGGLAKSVNAYLKLYNEGVRLEEDYKLNPIFVNYDPKPYPETKAVFGSTTSDWQKSHPDYVKYMASGQYVQPVNAAMYAKLRYTPWVDFPPQGSHPLDDWQKLFNSF